MWVFLSQPIPPSSIIREEIVRLHQQGWDQFYAGEPCPNEEGISWMGWEAAQRRHNKFLQKWKEMQARRK